MVGRAGGGGHSTQREQPVLSSWDVLVHLGSGPGAWSGEMGAV